MSLIVAADDLQWFEGAGLVRTWDTRGDDGTIKRCAFCPECGTRIFHGSEHADAEKFACYAREPDDESELERRWRERRGAG